MASTAASVEKFCMKDGEIRARFSAGKLGVLHSPDGLLVSMLFTAELVCSIESRSLRGIFCTGFNF